MSARERHAALISAASEQPRTSPRLVVGLGSCGRARQMGALASRLRGAASRHAAMPEVVVAGCSGLCTQGGTVVKLGRDGAAEWFVGVTPQAAAALLDGDAGDKIDGPPGRRLVSRDLGLVDPLDLGDYLARGGYAMLARLLDELSPEEVIAEVRAANLIGRGGAYFPTAVKWQGAREARGEPKWLVVNAEEGEPGVFKDRHLLEGDPHRVLEGMLIAAYAVGASRGIFYINGEAYGSQAAVREAVQQARERGLLGERVLGTSFSFELEVRHGAGGYILGEETALLESIEGRRAMPRVRPPFPVERGLWGKPTVVNNAETLATLRSIFELGGSAFAEIGLPEASGTKLIGLSGNVARPGLYEVEFGTMMRQVVEGLGGGVPGGRQLKAVLIGGPSGVFVPASALDEPIRPRGVVPPGTGGWVILDERQSIPEAVRDLTRFNMLESCGKCTPCREGTVRLVALLDGMAEGSGARGAVEQMRVLNEVVELGSLCGLGQMAPRPIQSALEHFGGEFEAWSAELERQKEPW